MTSFRERNKDVELTVERVIASDDEIVGIWTWRATHSTDMYAVPPTGGKLEVRVASIFWLRGGMLVDYEVISDALTGFRRMCATVESAHLIPEPACSYLGRLPQPVAERTVWRWLDRYRAVVAEAEPPRHHR